jgi:tetratricopeptide (TPR) repeat protein
MVWTASGGNPFVAVEMVQALRHGSAGSTPPLPRKVHDLIADRLERLGERAQELAALAALMAGPIDFALLARASGLASPEVADGLEELVRRRILHAVDERFAFVHDRVRDVALKRLLPPRRRLLHRRIAEAAEALYAADLTAHAATLGFHYHAAELWERALPFLRRAGRHALAAGAQREAVVRFEQAIQALEHLPATPEHKTEAIDLRIDLRHALIQLDAFAAIKTHLVAGERIARELGDRARLGRVLALLANCHFNHADYALGRELCAQAELIARELDDRALEATVVMFLGMVCHQTGDHLTGAEYYRRFLRNANEGVVGERSGISGLTLVYARAYLCICLAELGEFTEGYAVAEETIRRADALRHPWALAHASLAMSCLAVRQGRPERALACYAWYRDALQSGDEVWPLVDAWAAYAEVIAGRAADALPRLDAGNAMLLIGPAIQLWRAEACVQLGRLREARTLAAAAMETGRRRGEASYEAWGLFLLAEIAARGGARGGDAEEAFGEALAIACKRGYRPLEALARLGLGRVHARAGRDEAAAEIEAARALLLDLGMTRWLETADGPAR